MLSHISKLFIRHRKRRNRCLVMMPIRSRQFERLECRSMLSAGMGGAPAAFNRHAFDNIVHDVPLHGNEGTYAAIPQFSSADGYLLRVEKPHYAHLDSYNQFRSTYNNDIGDDPAGWNLVGQFVPPSSNVAMSSAASSNKPLAAWSLTSPSIIIVYVSNYQQYFENYPTSSPPSQPPIARATAPPALSNNLPQPMKSNGDRTPNIQKASDLYLTNNMSAAAAAATVPSAAQIIARYADKSPLAPTAAFDAALQSYLPPRLFVTNSATADRTYSATSRETTVVSDNSFDDFIELTKSSSAHTTNSTSDDSSIEVDAVSEVLDHLQELELAPWRTSGLDAQIVKDSSNNSGPEDALLALARADFALANAEGGMVMLDVNNGQSSDIDFSNIAVSDAISPTSHLNLDSAVGFYQVVEVAGEEAPGAIRTTSNAPVQSVKHVRTENRLPTERQRATNEKAGVVAGVSALIGAAVWFAQRKQSGTEATINDTSTRRRRVV